MGRPRKVKVEAAAEGVTSTEAKPQEAIVAEVEVVKKAEPSKVYMHKMRPLKNFDVREGNIVDLDDRDTQGRPKIVQNEKGIWVDPSEVGTFEKLGYFVDKTTPTWIYHKTEQPRTVREDQVASFVEKGWSRTVQCAPGHHYENTHDGAFVLKKDVAA